MLIHSEIVDQLIFILESKPELSQFERDIINDIVTRYKQYGRKTHLSKKQVKVIGEIYLKVKISNLELL